MKKIEVYEQLTLFNEFEMQELENEDSYYIEEEANHLDEQIESLLRRRFKKGKNYVAILAGELGLWHGNPFGHRKLDFNNFTVFLENYYTDVTIDEYGALCFGFIHHDGVHRMNLYLVEEEAFESNPFHMQDYLFNKAPIQIDEIFMKAYGYTNEHYEILN